MHIGGPNIGDRDTFLRPVDGILGRLWLTNDGPMVRELTPDRIRAAKEPAHRNARELSDATDLATSHAFVTRLLGG